MGAGASISDEETVRVTKLIADISGDKSDVRHLDAKGIVVALYAKGKAKLDQTGFVFDRKVIPIQAIA